MSQWRDIKLKDLCDKVTVGYVGPMAHEYQDTGVTFLRSLNIKPFRLELTDVKFVSEEFHHRIRKSALNPGDVAVVRTGYPGTAAVVPKALPVSNCSDLVIVRPGKDLNPHFITAILNSTFGQTLVSGNTVGAAQQHFNITVAKELKFRVPPRQLQDKIAAILSAYDELMENNRRRISLLEKLAEEIYREWFVRLRFPGHEKMKLVKGVPETWNEKKFGNFCVLQRGHDLPDADVVPGPYPIIASTSIKGYHHEFKALPPVVTTGRSGSLGVVLMIHTKAWPLNTALYVKDFCGNSAFLVYYTLKNMGLEKFNAGAGVPSLNRNHLTGIKINVPDGPLQKRFDDLVGPIHEQKEQLVKVNDALRQTRDLLLPRLISGKLSVKELDIHFPPGMAAE
jgi:type I restriction enzyme S subunit